MNYNHNLVPPTVYLGEPISDASERAFLERLRSDLAGPALIIANFFPVRAKDSRQIDFFIWTPARSVLVELKTLDRRRPISGQSNGRWSQHRPGGARELDSNPIRQSLSASYAVSDSMRALHQDDESIPAAGYRNFHSVVCLNPVIPEGSEIDHHKYVRVVDYETLLELLNGTGTRNVPWRPEHWHGFLRFLGVYPESDDAPDALAARQAAADLADYRACFIANQVDRLERSGVAAGRDPARGRWYLRPSA